MPKRRDKGGHFIPLSYEDTNFYEITLYQMNVLPEGTGGWLVRVDDIVQDGDIDGIQFWGPFATATAAAKWADEHHPSEVEGGNPFLAGNFAGKKPPSPYAS